MQSAKLVKVIARLTAEYEKEINVVLPRKVAVMAKQHFRNNFRQSGFVDGGLRPWQRAQREGGIEHLSSVPYAYLCTQPLNEQYRSCAE